VSEDKVSVDARALRDLMLNAHVLVGAMRRETGLLDQDLLAEFLSEFDRAFEVLEPEALSVISTQGLFRAPGP
jgi:hypothetical protein